jgi:hypothetical protein
MLSAHPSISRPVRRLVTQLVPAALVTTVGVLLLSNLAKAPATTPAAAPVETAINAEAVFKITPREPAEIPAAKTAAIRPANPKALAANTPLPPSRKPANELASPRQVASLPAPLPTVQIAEQPQPAAATPSNENWVMGKLRSATATVQQAPRWATRSVAGWFAAEAPPRPPASVPGQNFQAAM